MHLLTIIGNAVVDGKFRSRLFDDPEGTAQAYGFRLTGDEVTRLQQLAASREDLEESMQDVEDDIVKALNCPRRPCGIALAESCEGGSRSAAAD